jgi:ATP-dependent protease ClpP protease subunit
MNHEDFKYLVSRTEKQYTFNLFGEIGKDKDVNGYYLANEINSASEYVDVINIHINSEGGSIMHGLAILSAIHNSTAHVNVIIDGIAASMAGVIAMAGDTIKMVDYGRLMVHNPFFDDKSNLTKKEAAALDSMKAMLVTIFTNRCGKDDEWMSNVMDKETWFTAEEALANKLIDSIITTGKVVNLSGLSITQMVALIKDTNQIHEMKKIALKLGMPEGSTEDQLVAKVEEIMNQAKKSSENAVKAFISHGMALKVITDENKDKFEKLANTDFDLAVSFLENKTLVNQVTDPDPNDPKNTGAKKVDPQESIRLSDIIKELKNQGSSQEPVKDFEWYQKNDPKALEELERTNKVEFDKLYNAWVKKK